MRLSALTAGLLTLALTGFIGAYYFFYASPPKAVVSATPIAESQLAYVVPSAPKAPPLAAPRTPPEGYKEFRNEFYRFQMLYPQDMTATKIDGKGSSATITFETADHAHDFELFITPYGAATVTPERFALDEPSGVMEQPADITVGGIPARFFYGKNAALGDTAEIWFINKGFLYEMATYKDNGAWLMEAAEGWMPL